MQSFFVLPACQPNGVPWPANDSGPQNPRFPPDYPGWRWRSPMVPLSYNLRPPAKEDCVRLEG
jgi:hypothetical protein